VASGNLHPLTHMFHRVIRVKIETYSSFDDPQFT
jgi:hypothetical protein